jgi:MFS family permease
MNGVKQTAGIKLAVCFLYEQHWDKVVKQMNVNQFLNLLAVTFLMIPISAVRPMTSLFATDLGASEAQIGLLTACFSLAPLFLAVFAGRFIDQFGEKIPVLAGAVGIVVALTSIYLLPYLGTAYFAQLLLGGSQLLTFVALQNRVVSSVPPERRNHAVASFSLYASVGSMIGPLLGGYATEEFGFTLSYLLFAVFALYPLLLSVFVIPREKRVKNEEEQKHSIKELFHITGLSQAIVISMLILAALDIFYVYFPLYASSIGLSPSEIGWVLTIFSVATMVSRIFLPKLVERFGKNRVLFFFMFGGAVFYGLTPLFDGMAILAILAFFNGFGLGVIQPLTIVICYNLAPNGRTGEVLATRMAGNRLAQVVIPVLFAGLVHLTGVGGILMIKGTMLALGSFLSKTLPE